METYFKVIENRRVANFLIVSEVLIKEIDQPTLTGASHTFHGLTSYKGQGRFPAFFVDKELSCQAGEFF
ncbi:hypothetical protein ACX8XP_17980 [Calditrichota bacterium LG25]